MNRTEEHAEGAPSNADLREDRRADYTPPRLEKKRALTRVTLFSGSGAAGTSGLTAL